MLVLTRKKGESIRIGDGVIVKVLENSGKQVKIGINVAREVPVYREEIYEKIQKDNKKAILQNNSGVNSLENLIKIKNKYKHKK
jgi:carbon storage regulator